MHEHFMKVAWNGIIKQVYVETSEEEVAPDNSDVHIVDTRSKYNVFP